ncbi:ABC-type branched-subunit amino acid transport system ATPase component [Friedmanniella endophytica]|uniref:ABC-type branched-subunit amino acid transport system ATPase component n=1 Tax=Microlunatus kandeliicorticis TaxID=1759536 RepID=A0A7W3IVT8_9ACTN|nr:ABC-type branched-subunit amino acid transport system ATPase component [Microlunatus kandeliicorticis]
MIVWLNGPFGAGKTTTAGLLTADGTWGLFDTERVGLMLRHALERACPVPDFQDWPAWRAVSVAAVAAVARQRERPVVVPQTVVVEAYWSELRAGLTAAGQRVRAFTLHVDAAEHERRIAADEVEPHAGGWRRERRADYEAALGWLARETTVIDTTALDPAAVADRVRAELARP